MKKTICEATVDCGGRVWPWRPWAARPSACGAVPSWPPPVNDVPVMTLSVSAASSAASSVARIDSSNCTTLSSCCKGRDGVGRGGGGGVGRGGGGGMGKGRSGEGRRGKGRSGEGRRRRNGEGAEWGGEEGEGAECKGGIFTNRNNCLVWILNFRSKSSKVLINA